MMMNNKYKCPYCHKDSDLLIIVENIERVSTATFQGVDSDDSPKWDEETFKTLCEENEEPFKYYSDCCSRQIYFDNGKAQKGEV